MWRESNPSEHGGQPRIEDGDQGSSVVHQHHPKWVGRHMGAFPPSSRSVCPFTRNADRLGRRKGVLLSLARRPLSTDPFWVVMVMRVSKEPIHVERESNPSEHGGQPRIEDRDQGSSVVHQHHIAG